MNPVTPRRRTKIVATIGPATSTFEAISALVAAGVDVVRLNCSHGTQEARAKLAGWVREAGALHQRSVAILLDLQGPKIRTGLLAGGQPIDLTPGQSFAITTRQIAGSTEMVSTTYQALPSDVSPGCRILLSDGAIELEVLSVDGDTVHCRVVDGGRLAERQGINLPGVPVSAPALTEKDAADLEHGLGIGIDYVALSFVRRPDDVRLVQKRIRELGHRTPVVAKIEKPEALDHLDRILAIADGVMVARGDLGVEVPLEQVPLIQKRIIRLARLHRVPVIVATQMLETMITNERPTRAEVSDVANAIFDSADAIMLSGETAVGAHPVRVVETMSRVATAAECEAGLARDDARRIVEVLLRGQARVGRSASLAHAAVDLARDIRAKALVAITRTGFTAKLVSSFRPETPIYAVTDDDSVRQALAGYWGVETLVESLTGTVIATLAGVERQLLERGLVAPGDTLVVLGGGAHSPRGRTNFLRLYDIPRHR